MNRPFDTAARRHPRTGTAEPAAYAFTAAAQREWLTPPGYALLRQAIADGHGLGRDLAHEVARALRGWAASRGATHVAFRVDPLAGEPGEYRLELPRLSGDDLVGGMRATAATTTAAAPGRRFGPARSRVAVAGRLTWDPASPAYLRVDAGGAVLCLPSVLASASGEALDHRLPLMRSEDALAAAAARALRVLDDLAPERVQATVALTRGYELVDAEPGLPRSTADRVTACVIAAERELDRVSAGVRIGGQELTVLPAATGVSSDRLGLAFAVLADVAPRYGLRVHERAAGPDAWSLMAGPHTNLLAPGRTPRAHGRFAFFAAAVMRAFATYPELVGPLDLGPDLRAIFASLARGELFAGSDEERACGAPPLPRVYGRDTAYGFTGAGFALGRLDAAAATVVNTIVAGALVEQTRALEAWTAAGEDREPAIREVIADAYRRHLHAQAEREAAVAVPGHAPLVSDATVRLFAEQSVMSARELAARRAAELEEEARVAVERARAYVTPAAIRRRARLSPRDRDLSTGRHVAEFDEALRTVQAASRALDAVVAAGETEGVPPLLEDLRAAARRLTR